MGAVDRLSLSLSFNGGDFFGAMSGHKHAIGTYDGADSVGQEQEF